MVWCLPPRRTDHPGPRGRKSSSFIFKAPVIRANEYVSVAISARSRRSRNVSVRIDLSSLRQASASSTGVLPVFTTCLGPRTAAAGLVVRSERQEEGASPSFFKIIWRVASVLVDFSWACPPTHDERSRENDCRTGKGSARHAGEPERGAPHNSQRAPLLNVENDSDTVSLAI